MMRDKKERNYGRSNNWCSRDGINQKYYDCSGKIKTRAYRRSKREILSKIPLDPPHTNLVAMNAGTPDLTALKITGIVIGSFIGLAMIIYCLVLFTKKTNTSGSQEEEGKGQGDLTITFVRHNHAMPELCTTPDTQPTLDYYSSKAGLTNSSSAPVKNDNDRKSITIEVNEISENIKKSSEDNNKYVPQYYNGMEIPPLGARIIPLERQVQIAKELTEIAGLTSSNSNPINNNNNKRKRSRSISSILSISSRRKSSSTTNTTTNNNCYNNSNSSTTNTLSLIRETPQKEH